MDLQQKNGCDGTTVISLCDDQFFLLDFIMRTYLGPDVTCDNPRSSAVQRLIDNSRSYASTDLGPSYVSVAMLENLYYYLLRKAHPSLSLKPNMLHKYLKGSLHLPNSKHPKETRQFTSFFPLDLHKQIWYPANFRIVKGVVLMEDPKTLGLDERDLEKFKSLTCIDSFQIDMYEFVNFEHEYQIGINSEQSGVDKRKEMITRHGSNGNKRRLEGVTEAKDCSKEEDCKRTCIPNGAYMVSLLSIPHVENIISKSDVSIVVTGSASRGKSGPPVGSLDVGVGKAAYYFRVALPGVRKDYCNAS